MKMHRMDQIEKDCYEAERLGYGVHYGAYIAARDNCTDDYLKRLKNPPNPQRPLQADTEPEQIEPPKKPEMPKCPVCGQPVLEKRRQTCSRKCAYELRAKTRKGV